MKSGRKVIPFKMLQLKGTAHVTRQGDGKNAIEPGDPSVPAARRFKFPSLPRDTTLGPVGRKEWRFVRKQMEATGVILAVDHATLFAYCALWEQAATNPNAMTGSLWTQLRMFAAELGFTPSSRERLRRPIAD